jgi:hypothetical protein
MDRGRQRQRAHESNAGNTPRRLRAVSDASSEAMPRLPQATT